MNDRLNDMNDSVTELSEKINGLEKLYDQTLQNVTHNIDMFWMLIFGVVSVMGIALFFISKQIVNNKVGSEIEKIKSELQKKQDDYQRKINQQDIVIREFKRKLTEISVNVFNGEDHPEGTVTAKKGTLYLRMDEGSRATLYVKEFGTGNTGWVAK